MNEKQKYEQPLATKNHNLPRLAQPERPVNARDRRQSYYSRRKEFRVVVLSLHLFLMCGIRRCPSCRSRVCVCVCVVVLTIAFLFASAS